MTYINVVIFSALKGHGLNFGQQFFFKCWLLIRNAFNTNLKHCIYNKLENIKFGKNRDHTP